MKNDKQAAMLETLDEPDRRTTTDQVFDRLYAEIASLDLLPGTKLSEVEIARRFGVSRQPVRDAFNRLGHMDLLLIRPQRATRVRGFSMARIAHARFVRLALELEVIRRACTVWDDGMAATLAHNLDRQGAAIQGGKMDTLHALDREFHTLICELAGLGMAARTIMDCKRQVDRLCILSLERDSEAAVLLDDHRALADALRMRAVDDATAIARRHLGRLDDTIDAIRRSHADYFE